MSGDWEGWQAYSQVQEQQWRTEPEISIERQQYLAKRRAITPDRPKGVYRFKDIESKLTRADIEWLLATHEGGQGPVDWSDERQRRRDGLDLSHADLRGVDLSFLPLAKVDLEHAQLQNAKLWEAELQGARLWGAQLQNANLGAVRLQEASLLSASLQGAFLWGAQLQGASLRDVDLRGADLQESILDVTTELKDVLLDTKTRIADVVWNSTPLTQVNWDTMPILGDEYQARQAYDYCHLHSAVFREVIPGDKAR